MADKKEFSAADYAAQRAALDEQIRVAEDDHHRAGYQQVLGEATQDDVDKALVTLDALKSNAQSNYQARVADQNAKLAAEAARTQQDATRQELQSHWRRQAQLQGQQRVAMAAGGLDLGFGNAADLQADDAEAEAGRAPVASAAHVANGLSVLDEMASGHGWSSETLSFEKERWQSGVYKRIASGMTQRGEITQAEAYIKAHEGKFTAGDLAGLMADLKGPLDKRAAADDVDRATAFTFRPSTCRWVHWLRNRPAIVSLKRPVLRVGLP